MEDVRILAVEQYGAGPFGSLHLAELGADVIKIEDPWQGGDVGRYVPPFQEGQDSLFFEAFNRNKRSISLDITTDAGRSVFEDLVRVSDGVYSNLRGDVPEKLRLRYDDLKHLNPAIVCASLTGFGMTGPRSSEPGYDYVMQGLAGWMDVTGEPDGPPTKSGLSLVDYAGGLVAVISMLAALHAARRDGLGCDCDVSLFDTAVAMLTYPAIWQLNGDFEPARTHHSAHPSIVPFQAFPASDGWIVVACPKEKFWRRLTVVIGQPQLAHDPAYATFAARRQNAQELVARLEQVFRSRSVGYWLDKLKTAGVPSGPVNSVAEALQDSQTKARGMVVETAHPHFETVRQVSTAVRVGQDRGPFRRAPRRNEDADYLLHDLLRYDDEHLAALVREQAFGPSHPPGGGDG